MSDPQRLSPDNYVQAEWNLSNDPTEHRIAIDVPPKGCPTDDQIARK
ncbi:hypothetical protein GWI33_007647, partial [Rhynchophorus ferrugineus]